MTDFNTSLVNLNTELRPVSTGGTGAATLTANGVLYGNGTSALSVTAQGGTRTILTANAGAPSWSAAPIINTSVQIGVVSSTTGSLSLANSSSANLTTFQAGNATEANTYRWPADGGSANQVLTTDGATPTTVLTWSTPSTETGTWADLTASRAVDTIYQNTSGRMRRVSIVWSIGDGANSGLIQVGSASPPANAIQRFGLNGAVGNSVFFYSFYMVPNNWYHRAATNAGTITITSWWEMDE